MKAPKTTKFLVSVVLGTGLAVAVLQLAFYLYKKDADSKLVGAENFHDGSGGSLPASASPAQQVAASQNESLPNDLTPEEKLERSIAEFRKGKNYPHLEPYISVHVGMRFGPFVQSLHLSREKSDAILSKILDISLPNSYSTTAKLQAELKEELGAEDFNRFLGLKNAERQDAIDASITSEFIQANPGLSPESSAKLATLVSQIQLPENIHAIINLQTNVSEEVLATFSQQMNQNIEQVLANSDLDPALRGSLRTLLQKEYLHGYCGTLRNRLQYPSLTAIK